MSSRFAVAAEDKLMEAKSGDAESENVALASAIVYALLDVASAVRLLEKPEV